MVELTGEFLNTINVIDENDPNGAKAMLPSMHIRTHDAAPDNADFLLSQCNCTKLSVAGTIWM